MVRLPHVRSAVMDLPENTTTFPRTYFILLFGTLLAVLCVVIGINLYAERVSGENVTDSSVNNGQLRNGATERGIKYQLLQKQRHLDFVLVGNSRVQRWDPQQITASTGARGFNGGVVGATLSDFRLMVEWLVKNAHAHHQAAPHVIIVMPLESIRQQSAPDDTDVPGFSKPVKRIDRARTKLERVKRLTQWQTLKQSLSILKKRRLDPPATPATTASTPPSADAGRPVIQGPNAGTTPATPPGKPSDTNFRSDGYLQYGAFYGAHIFGSPAALRAFVEGQSRNFYGALKLARGVNQLEPSAQKEIVRMLRAATNAGDTPTIVVPPIDQKTEKLLAGMGRSTFETTVFNWLESLHKSYRFTLLNYTDASEFGTASTAFYDGQHPRPALAAKIVDRLIKDDTRLKP